jgi:hypothetical protein
MLDGALYEVFVIDGASGPVDLETERRAIIRKADRGRYDLVYLNGTEETRLADFTRAYESPAGSVARLVSMALRHGTPLQFIVSQLQKDTGFADVERALARVLKGYLRDGEKSRRATASAPNAASGSLPGRMRQLPVMRV